MAFEVMLNGPGGAVYPQAYVLIGAATYHKMADTVAVTLVPFLSSAYREEQRTALDTFMQKRTAFEEAAAALETARQALADAHAAVATAQAAALAAPSDTGKQTAFAAARQTAASVKVTHDSAESAAGMAETLMRLAAEAVNVYQPIAVQLPEVTIENATATGVVREVDGHIVVDVAALYEAVKPKVPALASAEAV